MMTDDDAMKCIDYIRDNAPKYAAAKARRVQIENGLKSCKAKLMAEETGTLGAKEIYAYAHPDYETLINGLKEAVQIEEEIKYRMDAAKLKFEYWKVQSFNQRTETRLMHNV
jgi:hypothetical protein